MSSPAAKLQRIDPDALRHNPRATLAAWLKYQPLALAAYRMHPRPYVYEPSSMAPTTVVSRLRDAVRGCLAFSYPIEDSISHVDLLRWFSETCMKNTETQVIIGPTVATISTLQGLAKSETREYSYTVLSLEETIAFCILLSSGRITGPVKIQNPVDISLLPERDNVEVLNRPDGSIVLL